MRAPTRALAVVAVVFLLALAVAPVRCGRETPFVAGEPEPNLRFTDLDGDISESGGAGRAKDGSRLSDISDQEVALASFRGHVVVVNFWATWCAPCLAELPSLDRLHRALSRDGLVVLAVSVDERGTDVAAFAKEHGLTLRVLRDPGGHIAAAALHVEAYPTTFVIDAGGRLRERYLGIADWDLPEALDHFRGLMSESTSPTR